jgi:hypothetical protein
MNQEVGKATVAGNVVTLNYKANTVTRLFAVRLREDRIVTGVSDY